MLMPIFVERKIVHSSDLCAIYKISPLWFGLLQDEPKSEFLSTVQLLDMKTKQMTSKMTCYGSELSSKGMLWLAILLYLIAM